MSIILIGMPTIFVLILKMVDFGPLLTYQIPCSPRLRHMHVPTHYGFGQPEMGHQITHVLGREGGREGVSERMRKCVQSVA